MNRSLLLSLLALCLLFALPACHVGDDDDDSSDDDDASDDDDDDSAGDDDDSASQGDPIECNDEDNDAWCVEDGDCDDDNSEVHPEATEMCDGIDNNCDGVLDQEDAQDAATWYLDEDGDGYGIDSDTELACSQPHNYSAYDGDCDDTDPAFHPGATENDCCLLYTSPSPRDATLSRMPSSA